MSIIEIDRQELSEFSLNNASFILEILNDPDWLQSIGDRGVKTLDDTRDYTVNKLQKSYQNFDPAGHYARPDVTQLTVNRERQSTVTFTE